MTLTVKTTLAAMKMPLTVEKDGQRYSLDIVDDAQGTDIVIEKLEQEVEKRGGGGQRMSVLLLLATMLIGATSFADRTANQGWVKENFVSRTNEWKLAERRHALFILDLNAENDGKWRSFELKASTNNFAKIGGGEAANMVFWGCSDEADGYADGVNPILRDRGQDRMRLFWLTTRKGGDGRAWTKIPTTLDLTGANPKYIAALVSPDLCFDGRWLGEENEEVVWCYTRGDASGPEKDTNGAVIWHPIHPVRWFRNLPEWAR